MKKIIGVILFLCLAVLLVGCNNKVPYNAVIYAPNSMVIDDEVLLNNKVKDAHYVVRNESGLYDIVIDENAPIDRTIVIEDDTTFKNYIRENYITVDFEKQTVLVYFYLTYYHGRDLHISKIDYKENDEYKEDMKLSVLLSGDYVIDVPNIKVDFYDKSKGLKDNSGPSAGYAVVVLDKLDIKNCVFTYTNKD